MSDKMREEFELLYVDEMVLLMGEDFRSAAQRNVDFKRVDGSYDDPALRLALWAWKASRKSLVIELPWVHEGMMGLEFYDPEQVVKAITVTGVKVKL